MSFRQSFQVFSTYSPVESPGLLNQLARNTVWLFLARLSSQVLATIFTILIARYLGETGLGQIALITSILFIANIISTFGGDMLLVREIARTRNPINPVLTASVWVQLIISGILLMLILIGAGLIGVKSTEMSLSLKVYSFSLIPLAFYTAFSAVLRGYERMELFLIINLLVAIIQTGGAFLILRIGGGIYSLVFILLSSQVVGALAAGGLCYFKIPSFTFHLRVPSQWVIDTLKASWNLALLAILAVAIQRLSIIMLSVLSNDAATGWFAAASRITDSFKVLHFAFFGALFPLLSRSNLTSVSFATIKTEKPWNFQRMPFTVLLLSIIMISACITLFANPLILLIFGSKFVPSIEVLKILIWSLIPYTFSARYSLELVTKRKERSVVQGMIVTLALSTILSVRLIPLFGPAGAAMAVLGGELIFAVLLFFKNATRQRSS